MEGAAAAGFAGESGGEETVGAAGSRETAAGAPEGGSSTPAAGFIARESFSGPLRLPNTTALHTGGLLGPQLLDEGRQERTPRLFGFATACQPLRDLRNHLGGAMIGEISAIIWPLLAAEPNICGSNGIAAIGSFSIALANSLALISGRFGTPTWLRQYSGARSLGRDAFSRSNIFLVLRRLARSGAATIRISSAPTKARLVHPDHWCGTSSTMQGVVMRSVSKIESKASAPKS